MSEVSPGKPGAVAMVRRTGDDRGILGASSRKDGRMETILDCDGEHWEGRARYGPNGAECAIPTQTLGHCKRPATVHFAKKDGTCIAHVCAQHARGAGAARLLLPFPWEYDHVERYSR